MSIPGTGAISMSMVRTETSQSLLNDYSLYNSLMGSNGWTNPSYAPINVIGTSDLRLPGPAWSEGNPLNSTNVSMSLWYTYSHDAIVSIDTTESLYPHADTDCYTKTMLVVNVGTINKSLNLNISGSIDFACDLEIYYGKPWKNNGTAGTASNSALIYSAVNLTSLNTTIAYDYQYNSSFGQNIYFVLIRSCN
jgi:hypothetical protein